MRFLDRSDDERTATGAAETDAALAPLAEELSKLRRTVLRQGHAQELFQARVEEAVGRLPGRTAGPGAVSGGPGEAQVRALVEIDQALLQLLRLAGREIGPTPGEPPPDDLPRSLREGLALLQVRVRNLQHSLGLDAIPALGRRFDDRWHRACGVVHRPDLPEDAVVEEVLPGYRLGDRVVRPAMVVVNRRPHPGGEAGAEQPAADPPSDDDGPRPPRGRGDP